MDDIHDDRPTHLDLFSGIGGFSLAFEAEGFRTIGFSEIDPHACAVLKKHWPNVRNYGDVRNVPAVGCDVLTGGFPCQPFSLAGKRRGKADDRAIWPAMLAVIQRCRPAWVLGENVPGIINMELDRVLSDLESEGYTARTFIVPACAVDARHRRDRVWIVGHSNSERGQRKHVSIQPAEIFGTGPGSQIVGTGENVAFTERGRRREQLRIDSTRKSLPPTKRTKGTPGAGPSGQTLADADSDERHRRPGFVQMGRIGSKEGTSEDCKHRGTQWSPEPELGRVAHGIPHRAHRLKCLGNSIVPQVAQIFARAIYQQIRP